MMPCKSQLTWNNNHSGDGGIGHANPSDPMEVGAIYMKMNDVENMEGKDT